MSRQEGGKTTQEAKLRERSMSDVLVPESKKIIDVRQEEVAGTLHAI